MTTLSPHGSVRCPDLPPLVRRELLKDLRFLLAELADLEPVVINAANATEANPSRAKSVG